MTECYFCESTADIEEHHIVPQRFDGTDAETNLVDVCHDCHWKLERLYNKDFWEAIGIEDPRATREKHITCYKHGCTESATNSYTINGETGSARVHRCDEHYPREKQSSRERSSNSEHASDGDADNTVSKAQLEYAFESLVPEPPTTRSEIHEVFSRSTRFDNITVISDNGADHLRFRSGEREYDVEARDGEWVVWEHDEYPSAIDDRSAINSRLESIIDDLDNDPSHNPSKEAIVAKAIQCGIGELEAEYCLSGMEMVGRVERTFTISYKTTD